MANAALRAFGMRRTYDRLPRTRSMTCQTVLMEQLGMQHPRRAGRRFRFETRRNKPAETARTERSRLDGAVNVTLSAAGPRRMRCLRSDSGSGPVTHEAILHRSSRRVWRRRRCPEIQPSGPELSLRSLLSDYTDSGGHEQHSESDETDQSSHAADSTFSSRTAHFL
jgi:hypothetical protein